MIFYLQCAILIGFAVFAFIAICDFNIKEVGMTLIGLMAIIGIVLVLTWCLSGIVGHFVSSPAVKQPTIEQPSALSGKAGAR